MLSNEQIIELIQKSQRAETSVEEETLLLEWLHADPQHIVMLASGIDVEALILKWVDYEKMDTEEAEKRLWARWLQEREETTSAINERKPIPWIRYAVAAAVLVAIVGRVVMVYKARIGPAQQSMVPDVARMDPTKLPSPGTDKAILHLADGNDYLIDDTAKGYIARQGDLEFTKAGGAIYCKRIQGAVATSEVRYNTLETPRGGRYQLVLSDGSRVWMNSESQIQFPTVDTGNQRRVRLVGEAYFAIVHNKRKPFIVNANSGDITVKGTHFNVMAYGNENLSKVTLEEGRLSVHSGEQEVNVRPSYSAVYSKGSKPRLKKEANLGKILGWKNKQFYWDQDSLTTALRDIERWYNITVRYEGKRPTTVLDLVDSRNNPLLKVIGSLYKIDSTINYDLRKDTLFVSKRRLH